MTAPALITLAHGSRDPRSAKTIKALVGEVRQLRPDLRIEAAFLELSRPSFLQVVDRLVKAGYDEIVVVPLLLSDAYHAKVDVPERRRARPPSATPGSGCGRAASWAWRPRSSRCSTNVSARR